MTPTAAELFVDTSAIFALLDRGDINHAAAAAFFEAPADAFKLRTHSFVLAESSALVQRRLGTPSVRALHDGLLPAMDFVWVGDDLYRPAVTALLSAPGADVSLVDRISFELMRREGIASAFAFDRHFSAAGLQTVP